MFSIVVYSCLVNCSHLEASCISYVKMLYGLLSYFHLGIPTFGGKFVGLDRQHSFPAHISNRAIASFQFHIEWEEYQGPGKVQQ